MGDAPGVDIGDCDAEDGDEDEGRRGCWWCIPWINRFVLTSRNRLSGVWLLLLGWMSTVE
jgi:hypothetical protein